MQCVAIWLNTKQIDTKQSKNNAKRRKNNAKRCKTTQNNAKTTRNDAMPPPLKICGLDPSLPTSSRSGLYEAKKKMIWVNTSLNQLSWGIIQGKKVKKNAFMEVPWPYILKNKIWGKFNFLINEYWSKKINISIYKMQNKISKIHDKRFLP